jgi:sterol desaturase/sphingolipid hydroxylase (fatty acid hydroxylase superfamily)
MDASATDASIIRERTRCHMNLTDMEGPVYWTLFVAVFLAVSIWESYHPRGELSSPAERRWGRHGILLAISAVALSVVFRMSPVVVAVLAEGNRFGLLNKPGVPFVVRCVLAILVIDLAHYLTHRAFHSFSWLWRVHEVHHSDPDYDVSTAGRFHPLEVMLTHGCTLAVIVLLAAPPIAVLAAELLGAAVNLFVHANASLPVRLDRILRGVFVTPNMHRIHHSEEIREQSTNLGQIFGWWDRLFGTYLQDASAGEGGLVTGIKGQQHDRNLGVAVMLAAPFKGRQDEAEPVGERRSA